MKLHLLRSIFGIWFSVLFGFLGSAWSQEIDSPPSSSQAIFSAEPSKPPPKDQIEFFEKKIRPILVARCQGCHGGRKQNGELRLDSLAGLLAGGESGEAIVVPGKPAESLLIDAVRYNKLQMPPKGKLPIEEIELLEKWVSLGVPWSPEPHAALPLRGTNQRITDQDRAWWSFQPLARPTVPVVSTDTWSQNSIDRFILSKLIEKGIQPSQEATSRELARRLKLDLLGLPLTADEAKVFESDNSPDAYENQVDRWLENPHFGERWARHWLDLVRYAESDGYKQDAYRTSAWRYRDYVIRAFNHDKPYDRFVREQIAGDEIYPASEDTLVATGYLRAGIYEYNQRDVVSQWDLIVNELTDVTADVFLGLSMGCARCHDHKFDPISQEDYFRLRGVFVAVHFRDDVLLPPAPDEMDQADARSRWEQQTVALRAELATLEEGVRQKAAKSPIEKFPPQVRGILEKPDSLRSPYERQIAALAWRQVEIELEKIDFSKALKGADKERWEHCKSQLNALKAESPAQQREALVATDIGPLSPEIVGRNDQVIDPAPPQVLSSANDPPAEFTSRPFPQTTGRRTVFAQWLTSRENPLTARVIVNRIWQYHFGRGISDTASDFGRLGSNPTHPELLDWLACELIDSGWSLKHIHRLILTSSTYRQSAHGPGAADSFSKDPSNQWWGRMTIRRLEAEILRDSLLAVTGELSFAAGGPSVETSVPRRTIYTKVQRNKFDPLLDEFDLPDNILSTPLRDTTVTPNQALIMINGDWLLARAQSLAKEVVHAEDATADTWIASAYQRVFARLPTAAEKDAALAFRYDHPQKDEKQNQNAPPVWLIDFCHVLLNSNEMMYAD